MDKLTEKQKELLEDIRKEGPVWCRGSSFELVQSGRTVSACVVSNLRKKGALVGGGDSLFADNQNPQTLHPAQ